MNESEERARRGGARAHDRHPMRSSETSDTFIKDLSNEFKLNRATQKARGRARGVEAGARGEREAHVRSLG